MNLIVEHIASISNANVCIDGITVLAGYNGTGKSTIGKAFFAILRSYNGLQNKIMMTKLNSIMRAQRFYFDARGMNALYETVQQPDEKHEKIAEDILLGKIKIPQDREILLNILNSNIDEKENPKPAQVNSLFNATIEQILDVLNRPRSKYVEYIVTREFTRVFDGQINTIGSDIEGKLVLNDGGSQLAWVNFKDNKVDSCSDDEVPVEIPIYIEPAHYLDSMLRVSRVSWPGRRSSLKWSLNQVDEDYIKTETLEEHEERERICKQITDVICGKLVSNDNAWMYKDKNYSDLVSLSNIASGSKTFAVIEKLVENGAFHSKGILMIDEPEVNLHPAWQVKLAEILVILYEEMHIKIFVNTHSPYFLRAIEVAAEKYKVKDVCHYYRAFQENSLNRIEDVTECTEKIYQDLYMPLENL